jgi:hypothetical protein
MIAHRIIGMGDARVPGGPPANVRLPLAVLTTESAWPLCRTPRIATWATGPSARLGPCPWPGLLAGSEQATPGGRKLERAPPGPARGRCAQWQWSEVRARMLLGNARQLRPPR